MFQWPRLWKMSPLTVSLMVSNGGEENPLAKAEALESPSMPSKGSGVLTTETSKSKKILVLPQSSMWNQIPIMRHMMTMLMSLMVVETQRMLWV